MEIRIDEYSGQHEDYKLHVTLIDDNLIEFGLVSTELDEYITVDLDKVLAAIEFLKKQNG